jgi:hypothetical protein
VLSGAKGAKHDRVMLGRSSGDGDCVEIVAAEQLVKIINELRLGGFCSCPAALRVVVPQGDKLGVGVLMCPGGVLGGMNVPESENGYLDQIGHEQFFLESSRVVSRHPRPTVAAGGDKVSAAGE